MKVKIKRNIEEMYSTSGNFGHGHTKVSPEDEHAGHVERSKHQGLRNVTAEDTQRIIKSIDEELLDEAKEDDAYESYWKDHENDFRRILTWLYGRDGATMSTNKREKPHQMMARAKEMKKKYAPERSKRIKFLNWMTKMHKAGDSPRPIIDAVDLFLKYSPRMKEKNIHKYNSPDHVVGAYKEEVVQPRVAKARKERGDRENKFVDASEREYVYKDDNIEVVRPHTVNASCEYGKKTKWCISQHGNEYFDQYTQDEAKIFYFVLDDRRKNDDKYYKIAIQLTIDDDEDIEIDGYWDRYDNPGDQIPLPLERLEYNKVYKKETLEAFMQAIMDHAHANPPQKGQKAKLQKLEEEIWNGNHDNQYISFRSQADDDEPASISIETSLQFEFEVPMFEKHESEFIDEAWERALEAGMEETLAEYLGDDDKDRFGDFEYSGFYDQHMPLLEDHLFRTGENHMKLILPLKMKTFYEYENADGYLGEVTGHYSTEKVDDLKAELVGMIHNYMKNELNPEGKTGIENLAKNIWRLNSKFRYMVGHFEEGNVSEGQETAIYFSQKKPFIVPLKIPVWNKPIKGYSAVSDVNRQVKEFLSVLKVLVKERLEHTVKKAIWSIHQQARTFANKQTWIDFPNVSGRPEREIDMTHPLVGTQHKPQIDVLIGTPSVKDVRGEGDKPEVKVEINMMVTTENDPEDILWSVEYIRFIDNHFEEIYEEVFKKFNVEGRQKKIDTVFRDKVLHKDEDYLRSKGLAKNPWGGEPVPRLDEKLRKIKVKIK